MPSTAALAGGGLFSIVVIGIVLYALQGSPLTTERFSDPIQHLSQRLDAQERELQQLRAAQTHLHANVTAAFISFADHLRQLREEREQQDRAAGITSAAGGGAIAAAGGGDGTAAAAAAAAAAVAAAVANAAAVATAAAAAAAGAVCCASAPSGSRLARRRRSGPRH
eukprot:m.397067 g.397067  ORF g.397067 m.397067 type:complete len:167 (+) comp20104_c10_seq12:4858-5358(+)